MRKMVSMRLPIEIIEMIKELADIKLGSQSDIIIDLVKKEYRKEMK